MNERDVRIRHAARVLTEPERDRIASLLTASILEDGRLDIRPDQRIRDAVERLAQDGRIGRPDLMTLARATSLTIPEGRLWFAVCSFLLSNALVFVLASVVPGFKDVFESVDVEMPVIDRKSVV